MKHPRAGIPRCLLDSVVELVLGGSKSRVAGFGRSKRRLSIIVAPAESPAKQILEESPETMERICSVMEVSFEF